MNAIIALAQKDLRIIYRDRFMAFIAGYSLLLALFCRFLVPYIDFENLGLYLAPAVVLMAPILLGTLLGFALIEEREQGTWFLLRVLPIGSKLLFAYFAGVASLLSFLVSFASVLLYGYPVLDWHAMVFMLAVSALAAPLVMLLLGATAANKIEGLAISKILSGSALVAILVFVVPAPWQLLGAWCPWYWLYLGLLAAYSGGAAELSALSTLYWPGYSAWTSGGASLLLSILGMTLLTRLYSHRAG